VADNKHDDHENHDQIFMANFGKVMAGLGVIFAICIIAAVMIVGGTSIRDETVRLEQLEARLVPPGSVVTDPSQLVKVAAKVRDPLSGQQVVEKVCASCHVSGLLNAPKIGDAADWKARYAQGLDTLVKHSIEGIRLMPARGGDADLSDDEIRESVKQMLVDSGISL
jgi:cytochrome c5